MEDALMELGQWLLLLSLAIGQHLNERKLASTKYQLDELHEHDGRIRCDVLR